MIPSRRTQPYRRYSGREPGPTLEAMLLGRTAWGHNPADLQRALIRRRRRMGRFRY